MRGYVKALFGIMFVFLFLFVAGCGINEDPTDTDDNGNVDGGGDNNGGNNNGGGNNTGGVKGVTAVGSSSSSITISWNAVTGASSYEIYISENASGPYTRLDWGLSSLSFVSRNLAAATTFYYKVKTTINNKVLESSAVSATTLLTAPSGVKAESLTSSSITITWNNFPNAAGYRIYRSSSSSGTYTEIDTSTTNSYTDTEVASNIEYYYKVSARNDVLEGEPSSYVYAKVLLHAPKNVTAVGSSSSSITISWNAVTGASSYEIYISENASGPYTRLDWGLSSLSFVSRNLATATTFYYKVKASNNGQLSEPVSASTLTN